MPLIWTKVTFEGLILLSSIHYTSCIISRLWTLFVVNTFTTYLPNFPSYPTYPITNHITPSLQQLHWLPIHTRIPFKLCLLMCNKYSSFSSHYMSSMVTSCSSILSRQSLRSASKGDFICVGFCLKFGNRAFSWPWTAFQNWSTALQLSENSRQDWKRIFFHWTTTSHILLISTRHRERLVFYIVCATNVICIVL